ncbi:MAG TPA: hypothetical protein VKF35_02150, partial [Hyphomicrobiaceae bacterium]|nr:hypothetical protein [Hyphomicrobiaceae bacterium]
MFCWLRHPPIITPIGVQRQALLTERLPNDAHGIAQIVRVGWYREIGVKSMDTHAIRAMLVARAQLVTQKVKLTNCIRGLLKTFGIVLGAGKGRRFEAMVRE